MLIAQDEYRIYLYTRQPDHRWLLSETNQLLQVVQLTSIGCRLPLTEVYRKISF